MLEAQIDNYLYKLRKHTKSPTFNLYKGGILKFRQFLDIYEINSIKLDDVTIKFKKHLEDSDLSISTIYLVFTGLKGFLKYLKAEQIIDFNPDDIFSDDLMRQWYENNKTVKSDPIDKSIMGKMVYFWDFSDHDPKILRNKVIVILLFKYGLKTAEISNIKCSNIDFKKRIITITDSISPRSLRLEKKCADIIERYLELRNSVADDLIISFSHNDNNNNLGLTPRSIQRIVKETAIKAGIERDITPKDFRCTVVYNRAMDGFADDSTEKLLGMKSNIFTKKLLTVAKTAEILRKKGYISSREAAKLLKLSAHKVNDICRNNPEATLKIKGSWWYIKEDFVKNYKK